MDPYSFSSSHDSTYNPQTSLLEGTAWSDTRSCQQTVHFSFHCLVMILPLGQNTRSRSADLYLRHFPFCLVMTSSLGQSLRYRLPIYISDISSFSGQSLLMILLFIVSSYSDLFTYDNLGTFLVCLPIVLSLRKAPIGLVYKPTHVFLCSLASSTHQLPSNLVPLLRLPPVSSHCQLSNNYVVNL